jgi:K+-transporting ATPase c subunit
MKKLIASFLLVACAVTLAYAAYTKFIDVQVTGNLVVDGTSTLTGAVAATGAVISSDRVASPYTVFTSTYDVTVQTPTYTGQLALDGSYNVYVASGNAKPSQWIKVGGQ